MSVSLARLELLASAIAGRPLVVAPTEPGERSWTDGAVVHVDEGLAPSDQLRAVAVQAALVAAGSVDPEIARRLDRRGPVLDRYLAVEGHRALAANDAVLPPTVRALIDRSTAARSSSAAASLELAKGSKPVPDAPAAFGTIQPRRVRAVTADAGERESADTRHVPRRRRDEVLRELDDGEQPDEAGGFDGFNPVGGSGAMGRLLQRLLGTSRSKGDGQPGAEAATHRTSRGRRGARAAASSSNRVDATDGAVVGAPGERTYPEWNVHRHRYRPDWCTVVEAASSRATTWTSMRSSKPGSPSPRARCRRRRSTWTARGAVGSSRS